MLPDYQDSIGRKIVIGYWNLVSDRNLGRVYRKQIFSSCGNDREDDEEESREKTRENDGEMTRRGAEEKQGRGKEE